MTKFVAPLVAALMIAWAPVHAYEFKTAPETALFEGLDTLARCAATDRAAIDKLIVLIKQVEKEPGQNGHAKSKSMYTLAEKLHETLTTETKIGSDVVKALMEKYKNNAHELNDHLDYYLMDVKTDLDKALVGVDSFKDYNEKFHPKVITCDADKKKWADKLESVTERK